MCVCVCVMHVCGVYVCGGEGGRDHVCIDTLKNVRVYILTCISAGEHVGVLISSYI